MGDSLKKHPSIHKSNFMKTIFQNLVLLIRIYFYVLFRGSAKVKKDNKLKKILIMPASKLGDLVCATPIFRAIKKHDKRIQTMICASAMYTKLFDGNTDVDTYFSWSEKDFYKNISEFRKLDIDVAIITTPSFIASACFFLAGIKTVIVPKVINGFSPYQTKSYRLLWPLLITVPHRMGHYAPGEYLKLLEPLGIISEDTTKHLAYSKPVEMQSNKKYKIGIAPGVGNDIKLWNPMHFAVIAEYILKKYDASIYILGTKQDSEIISKMKSFMQTMENVIDVSGQFDLSDIKAFVSNLDLLIAVDTGLIYVAEAFNVSTIDIIGSMDENEQPPRGEKHRLVFLSGRKPEIHIMNSRSYDTEKARQHIDAITPEMVYPHIDELL